MRPDSAEALPDWVPGRLAMEHNRRSRTARWLIQRPERLLGWWLFVALFGLLGIVLVVVVMPVYLLPAFLVPTWIQLGVDWKYIARAARASRRPATNIDG